MNSIPNSGAAAARSDQAVAAMPQCPKCGWHDVRLSMLRGPLDHALSAFSLSPFRCRTCSHRFYRVLKRASAH